jgi:thiosulfate/3-mercaptopyruvate sulfurtransferase
MKTLILLILAPIYIFASTAFISSAQLKDKLDDTTVVILDVTDKKEYESGHIPNAIRVDISAFRHNVKTYQLMNPSKEIEAIVRSLGINNNSSVIIYGHGKSKELLKSSYIALALIINGLDKVSILNGGYADWMFEQNTKSTKTPKIKESNFVAKFNPNVLVDLKYVEKAIGKVSLLESRPSRFYYGKDQSKGVRRLGHIPTAITSFWGDKFNPDETIFSKSELKNIYLKTHKLDPNKEVIIYCTGGLEASMNWFIVYQELGFKNAKLYDASMREWGNRDDTPLEY